MPAPDASLLAALRDTNLPVARHLFFKLEHSQGTIYAWDGIGDYTLAGETYTGVGNLASVSGISQTRELQTHGVTITLQGVSLSALRETDQDIRGDAATLKAVWLDADGTEHGPITLFSGRGENLSISLDGSTCTLTCNLRGPMADWARPPAAYYTPGDQDRLFSGDTGMRFMAGLENASTGGWSVNTETTGAEALHINAPSNSKWGLYDSLDGTPIGDHLYGMAYRIGGTAVDGVRFMGFTDLTPTYRYLEADTAVIALCDRTGGPVNISGTDAYIDTSGDVRSVGGERIVRFGTSGAAYLRKQGAIASVGSATTNKVEFDALTSSGVFGPVLSGQNRAYTGSMPGAGTTDWTPLVYCNKYGLAGGVVRNSVSGDPITLLDDDLTAATEIRYLEHTSGNPLSWSGGFLQCDGADVTVSDTGALRTTNGEFITAGGTDADAFLRVWT